MCVVCVAGEVDSVRAKYGTWDTHGEAFTLLHERTFTSPGPWPLSQSVSSGERQFPSSSPITKSVSQSVSQSQSVSRF